MRWKTLLIICMMLNAVVTFNVMAARPYIHIRPTPFFPKPKAGEPLKQIATLTFNNTGEAAKFFARVTVGGHKPHTQPLGTLGKGKNQKDIHVPDVDEPTEVTVELLDSKGSVVGSKTAKWQSQKRYTVYFVSYSHQDLGFGDYPHRLRTTNRHANLRLPMEYCRLTDDWSADEQYRYSPETSEPITSFIASYGMDAAMELGRRIREGRMVFGAIHSTVNMEQLSHEAMARQFYLANRHACDLLDVPPSNEAKNNDVPGLPWPFATYCAAADVDYLYHGYNRLGMGEFGGSFFKPAHMEPVFYWQGPDGQGKVLIRHQSYAWHGDISRKRVSQVIGLVKRQNWPYDVLLMVDASDFRLVDFSRAEAIRDWNKQYAYPRAINATMEMYFDALAARKDQFSIPTFKGDANNEWANQDATDAMLLKKAREAGELIPTAEKLATIASVLTPGGYPWTDIYQAYHRLLTYHEHTDASVAGLSVPAQRYEVEQEENREMGREALGLGRRALREGLDRLTSAIATEADRTVAVFNPLGRTRTDVVRLKANLPNAFRLVDSVSGKPVTYQHHNEEILFVASDIPALGYKTFRVEAAGKAQAEPFVSSPAKDPVLENRFYRLRFDAERGGMLSIYDKELEVELVDRSAPQQFNEYLYERFEAESLDSNAWYRQEKAVFERSEGPVAQIMMVRPTAVGAENIRQQVILYEDLKRIDFVLSMDKSPSGLTLNGYLRRNVAGREALYVSLPFAVPDFAIRHEIPGAVIEPYRQQFEGSCVNHYAIRHFSDFSNDQFGVTVSAVDSALVQYDRPRSYPSLEGELYHETSRQYPKHSRLYLFLLNNTFKTNVRADQQGPHTYRYSMRSHAGDWVKGHASQFGWDVHNPLMGRVIEGRQKGTLPADEKSFVSIEPANIVCTTIKPAEFNGSGLVLRLVETSGKKTQAVVSLQFLDGIESANECNLVEMDRPAKLTVKDGQSVRAEILPFGVKTIRIHPKTPAEPIAVEEVAAEPLSDMEIALSWPVDEKAMNSISHFNVYRGETPDFKPTLLHLVARPVQPSCVDRPVLHYAGWINNQLDPDTAYYYRVAAVDRWNNEGPLSDAVSARTMKAREKNMVPLQVERLSAIPVSPISTDNSVALLFRTSCESDIEKYEIHRSTTAGFKPSEATRIGEVHSDAIIPGEDSYGHTPIDYPIKAFDHAMFDDQTVKPETTYYYRVCAVDEAGQYGAFSAEAPVKTGVVGKRKPEKRDKE